MTEETTSESVTTEANNNAHENGTETTEAAEKASADPVNNKEEKTQEEAGHKVFVGNLSFQTSEEHLAGFFGKTGKVLKANIISRGNRSLGYGFVALETEEDAHKVVEELNRQELDGRQINVEFAKPKSENAPNNNSGKSYYGSSYRGRGRFSFRGRNRGGRGRGGRGRGRGRGSGWNYNRRYNPRISNDRGERDHGERDENDSTAVNISDASAPNGNRKLRGGGGYRGRGRGYRGRGGRGRGGRGRGGRGGGRFYNRRRNNGYALNKSTEPSKTDIFVANLPFSVTDESLKEIFKSYDVKSAHVVVRRGGQSKGFGFVELASEEEQIKVIDAAKTFKSDGRELVIKIAMSNQRIQDEEDAVEKNEVIDAVDSGEKKEEG